MKLEMIRTSECEGEIWRDGHKIGRVECDEPEVLDSYEALTNMMRLTYADAPGQLYFNDWLDD